jgi:hypothetical protein
MPSDLRDIPTQSQEWPGDDSALNPRADHGETSWTGRDRLTGKRALVTGGDSGIGRAVAVVFAHEGADVAFTHLPAEADDARTTRDLIGSLGRSVHAIAADLRTAEASREVLATAVDELAGSICWYATPASR